MRAPELCALASDWLATRYPDALIIRELSVGKWGKALIDIAAILDDRIVGVEIKGEGDSAARLELQGHVYSRVASHMFLLTAPSLDTAADKHAPAGWWRLRIGSGGIDAGKLDQPIWQRGPLHSLDQLPNAPAALLECLITRELKLLGRAITPAIDIGKTVPDMIAAISENASLLAVRRGVCEALRRRDWLGYDRSINKARHDRYRWADGRKQVGAERDADVRARLAAWEAEIAARVSGHAIAPEPATLDNAAALASARKDDDADRNLRPLFQPPSE